MNKDNNTWRGLTTEEWERIEPLIPEPLRRGAHKKVSDRQMVDALLCREYTKLPWSKLPGIEEDYLAVVKRYTRWRDNGTLQRVYEELDRMGLLPEEKTEAETEEAAEHSEKVLNWWELTDEQWEQIAGLLPPEAEQRGSRYKTNRQILDILVYRELTSTPWRKMPEEFGPWRTAFTRYTNWKEDGGIDAVFAELKRMGVLASDRYRPQQTETSGQEETPDWWEVTEEQWQQLACLFLPTEFGGRGKRPASNRLMLNAILCKYRTKTIWTQLPKKYGSWRTVMERYRIWRDDGTLEQAFGVLGLPWPLAEEEPEPEVKPKEPVPRQWWELTDEQWEQVADLFPQNQPHKTGRNKSNRQVLNALLYREYTNTPWRKMPKDCVSWRTVFDRYTQWKNDGTLQKVFATLKRAGAIAAENYRQEEQDPHNECPMDWWEVTDEQWECIRPLFPQESANRIGRRSGSNRQILNAILCRYHTGTAWIDLPRKYGGWRTVIERYKTWRDAELLDLVFAQLNK